MVTYYLVKLDVDDDPSLSQAFAVFDDDPVRVEEEARDGARGLLRPKGTPVVWSYYGPFEMAGDRITDSCNFGSV